MSDYDKICNFESLYEAHKVARRGKRHKAEVINFEMNLSKNLTIMQEQLEKKTYKMKGYYHFTIYEPKTRQIYATQYADRVMIHCVCDQVLSPILQKKLIYDNAACQVGKGTHFAMNRLTTFFRDFYKKHGTKGYILKCDIQKYFPSIDHEVLKEKLAKAIVDKDVRNLLNDMIDGFETDGCPGKGIPLGNQSSQWFSIYYLDTLDRFVKEQLRIKYYTRYMDDIIMVHESKEYLNDCLIKMTEVLEQELLLSFNGKTQLFPIKNGVEYIGFRFYLTDSGKVIRKIKVQSKLRYKRDLKRLQSDYAAGRINLDKVNNSLASYNGYLNHGHTYQLKRNTLRNFVLKRDEILNT